MARRNFAQILKEAKIDIKKEYDRLYQSFYNQKFFDGYNYNVTLKDSCELYFLNYPFRGTCLSLEDFDNSHKFNFEKVPTKFNLNYLISFCEYTYNLVSNLNTMNPMGLTGLQNQQQIFCIQISKVIEAVGYVPINKEGIIIFLPNSQEAIAVSEIVDPKVSYKVIEYNHHTLQGNIEGKKAILFQLANLLEHEKDRLKQINNEMEDNLFALFNNLNIRHDNCSTNSVHYKEYIAKMSRKELENWYDETYQLCLLAFLELDNIERNKKIKDLKRQISKKNKQN